MKKIYRKEEGVSPVIATILMVAITVVLAATVYIMVAGLGGGTTTARVAGSLTYRSEYSSDTKAVFELSLTQPPSTDESKISVTVLDNTGATVDSSTYTPSYTHVVTSGTTLKSGDMVVVTLSSGTFSSGYKVILTIAGYQGTIEGTVP